MTYLTSPLVTEKGKHRLHAYLNRLLVLTAGLGLAINSVIRGRANLSDDEYMGIMTNAFDLKIRFPMTVPIRLAWENKEPDRIELILDAIPPRGPDPGLNPDMVQIFGLAGPPIFINFYESHRPWVEDNIGTLSQWPSIFAFARVIRHSMAHGGALHMTDKKQQPVSWHHLRYSVSDHGKRVYGPGCDLYLSDLLLLMFEMSDELNKAGCPLDPI